MNAKEEAKAHIDAKAGAVRACYITIAPGQEATYLLKAAQARAQVAAGFSLPVKELIEAEMLATHDTLQDACTRILSEEAQWEYLAGLIEKIRRPAKVHIDAAMSDEEIAAIRDEAVAQLSDIMPTP